MRTLIGTAFSLLLLVIGLAVPELLLTAGTAARGTAPGGARRSHHE